MRDVGSDGLVLRRLFSNSIPLFVEDNPSVQGLIEGAAMADSLRAIFRLGFREFFRYQGNVSYGLELMPWAAREGIERAVYVCGIILAARSSPDGSEDGRLAEKLWKNINSLESINMFRVMIDPWLALLKRRLPPGPLFHSYPFYRCDLHDRNDRPAWGCIRCSIDIEVEWFAEGLGVDYVTYW